MKRWMTPELIVLRAGKPEESVLLSCKSGTSAIANSFSGPQTTYAICEYATVTGGECMACSVVASS